jgi:hypothetical protein
MPTILKTKNSVTTTVVPTTLQQGELAVNITDKKLWVGNAATTPVQLLGGGADGTFTNISVSGVATFGAGTVSLPSITTTGDTNTGIFFPAADTIAFTEGGVESMRIDSSGNVGIGASIPSQKLVVAQGTKATTAVVTNIVGMQTTDASTFGLFVRQKLDATAANRWMGLTSFDNGVGAANLILQDLGGNVGIENTSPSSYNGIADNLVVGSTGANGITIVSGTTSTGNLFFGDGTSGTDAYRGYMQYEHTSDYLAFGTAATERMRIDSSGNTFIGGTTGFGRLVVNASASDIYLGYNGATKQFAVDGAGQIYAQFTTITSLSDRRAKENIKPIQYGLNEILKLNPVTFNFIAYPQFGPTYGFIAQEVEPLLPELVGNEKDNKAEDGTPYKTLKMGDMLPVMVKAIQELKATVDAQAARIAALESK